MNVEDRIAPDGGTSIPVTDRPDVFFIYSERERHVEGIAEYLAANGISSHMFRRDIPVGEEFKQTETDRLRNASVVLVLLGSKGWGPTHRQMTGEAQSLGKPVLPALIGDPPGDALKDVGGLFESKRYIDLRSDASHSLQQLVREIRRHLPSPRFGRIIAVLVDGDEIDRANQLDEIITSSALDRAGLAARLRTEITTNFAPGAERQFATASRDPKRISSARSWMLSALIWSDPLAAESEKLIVEHAHAAVESDRNVRFWLIAGAYQRKLPYLRRMIGADTVDAEVRLLGQAIENPNDPGLLEELQTRLVDREFENVWPVLRVLRIVPIPAVAPEVCAQLDRWATGKPLTYDVLYALTQPEMAKAAVPILTEEPGLAAVIDRMIEQSRGAHGNHLRAFAALLGHFPESYEMLLDRPEWNYEDREIARVLRSHLRTHSRAGQRELYVAGYASDTIDVAKDDLDIAEDVQTLAAVMLAREVNPPLAIGLFGDWGTGKSFFMQSMRRAVEDLADREHDKPNSRFHSNVAQIEFNAWHYIDANLWASMVSHILESLAAIVTPAQAIADQTKSLITELESARAFFSEAERERERAEEQIKGAQDELQTVRLERETKKIELQNLRAADLHQLLKADEETTAQLNEALAQIGAPAVLGTLTRLSEAAAEARTLKGRIAALLHSMLTKSSRGLVVGLAVAILLLPMFVAIALTYFEAEIVLLGGVVGEIALLVGGGVKLVRDAITRVRPALQRIEEAKQRVDNLIAEKRSMPGPDEVKLQKEILELETQQQQAELRLRAAAARVVELEEHVTALRDANNLGKFLTERTTSEDYRRHLGLISTIRRDFNALASRLAGGATGPDGSTRPVERIILYVDDLDRCPPAMVIDVLQAVHLLLAYDLFVVVVGVDPRWLLRSLEEGFSPFQAGREGGKSSLWSTTPQNYLEKIFQIPFSLRPMESTGYSRLVERLMGGGRAAVEDSEDRLQQRQRKQDQPLPDAAAGEPAREAGEADREQEAEQAQAPPMPSLSPAKPPTGAGSGMPFTINEEALTISDVEMRFAEGLFAFIPTPRAAKRFVNVYRLLKAPLRRDELARFEGSGPRPGDFQVPMLLLALLIGAPAEAAKVFPKLLAAAKQGSDVVAMLSDFGSLGVENARSALLEESLKPIIGSESFPRSPELFVRWLPRIARFSFESGRTVHSLEGQDHSAGNVPDAAAAPESAR